MDGPDHPEIPPRGEQALLSTSLRENLDRLESLIGHSFDVKFRELKMNRGGGPDAGFVFIDGMVDEHVLHRDILRPLMLEESPPLEPGQEIEDIRSRLILIAELDLTGDMDSVVGGIFAGNTALFVDGSAQALILNTKGWRTRGVETPVSESDIRGPRDGFTEDMLPNVARLRRRFKDTSFHAEKLEIGRRTGTYVTLVYLRELVNPEVLETVRRELRRIDTEGIIESGYIQEHLSGRRWSLFPVIQATERPDRASASLLEGRIVIITDNSPFVLILPAVLASMFQAAGDYYHPSIIGTFLRVIRVVGWILGLFLPGLYVALSSINPEVLPSGLALALATSRQGVPYPAIVEVLIMDLAIELLAEASTRLPSVMGSAATLVGGLIIGTAAVEARIISSTMIIVVAVTAIGLFAIPSYELGLAWRISKYGITIAAAFFGLFGIATAFIALVIYLSSLRSFGQPYLSPLGPYRPGDFEDFVLRAPWWRLSPRSRTFATSRLHNRHGEGGDGFGD